MVLYGFSNSCVTALQVTTSTLQKVNSTVIKVSAAVVAGTAAVWLVYRRPRCVISPQSRLVAITGCDSGVGYSAAIHCHQQGFWVLAMVLSVDSKGAQVLTAIGKDSGRLEVLAVDVTKPEQVAAAVQQVTSWLDKDPPLVFHALMNNAGVMVFGETEWQTERIISQQLDVNLAGSIRVARLFAPVLRKYKGRLINVTSHCATLPLPGLAVYAASKAGLQAWSDALRVEWAKYGITVISFIPGALFQQTQILASQVQYAGEMKTAMTAEAAGFYGQYYHLYQMYLSGLGGGDPAAVVQSDALYRSLDSALLDSKPYTHYHDTPWRYRFYHTLAHLTSVPIRDFLVLRFTGMPPFIP